MLFATIRTKVAMLMPPQPEPIPAPPDIPENYAEVAARIGFKVKESTRRATLDRLLALGASSYDPKKVDLWLTKQYGKRSSNTGPTWCWRPMREKDHTPNPYEPSLEWHRPNGVIAEMLVPYDKPVPLPVLLLAEKVITEFPKAKLFVSDEVRQSEVLRDPFLAVQIDKEFFIIDRWDEPGYRE